MALEQVIENKRLSIVTSTLQQILPAPIIYLWNFLNIKLNEYSSLVYPSTHIANCKKLKKIVFGRHYGIDLIIFKLSKEKAIYLKEKL